MNDPAARKKRLRIVAVVAMIALGVGLWAFVFRGDARTLHIHVETLRDEDGAFHQRWTFTSGARWESYGTSHRNGEHVTVLEAPGQYDSGAIRLLKRASRSGVGTIVYEVEALRQPKATAPGLSDIRFTRTMKGQPGGSPSLSSTSSIQWPVGPWHSRFKVIQARDVELPLPVKVHLGVFGDTTEIIEFR